VIARLTLLLLALQGLSGCGEPDDATQIMLTVDTDLDEADGLDRIRIRILQETSEPPTMSDGVPPPLGTEKGTVVDMAGRAFEYRWLDETAIRSSDRGILPLEIGVVPEDGDRAGDTYHFEAFALREDGTVITRAATRTSFVGGERVRIFLWLTELCVGVSCPADYTCSNGVCVPVDLEGCAYPSDFDAGAGRGLPCDASTVDPVMDGGTDAPADAPVDSPIDAPVDTGPPTECDPGEWDPCGSDTCSPWPCCRGRYCGSDGFWEADECDQFTDEPCDGRRDSPTAACRGCRTANDQRGHFYCNGGSYERDCCNTAGGGCVDDSDCCDPDYTCNTTSSQCVE